MVSDEAIVWANAFREGGMPAAALDLLERIPHSKESGQSELLAAWAAFEAGRFDDSRKHLEKFVSLAGDTAEAKFLSHANAATETPRTYSDLLTFGEIPAGSRFHSATFLAASNAGDWRTALEAARMWVGETPQSPLAQQAVGVAEAAAGDLELGERAYRRAVEVAPNSAITRLSLASFLARINKRKEAAEVFAQGVEKWPADDRFAQGLVATAGVGRPGAGGLMYYVVAALASAIVRPIFEGMGFTPDQSTGLGLLVALAAGFGFHFWLRHRRGELAPDPKVRKAVDEARHRLGETQASRLTIIGFVGLIGFGAVLFLSYLSVRGDPTNEASNSSGALAFGIGGLALIVIGAFLLARARAAATRMARAAEAWKRRVEDLPDACICEAPSLLLGPEAEKYSRQHLRLDDQRSDLGVSLFSCPITSRRWLGKVDNKTISGLVPLPAPSSAPWGGTGVYL